MRRLQEDRHQGIIFLYPPHEVESCIEFFALAAVSLVDDHPHVGDYTHQIILVLFKIGESIVVASGQQDLRSGTLAILPLSLVLEFGQEFTALGDEQFVQLRQVGRIITDRVLYEQDHPDTDPEDIVVGISRIFYQLDDRKDQVGVAVPAEHEVDTALVIFKNTLPYGLGVMDEHNERDVASVLFKFRREGEDFPIPVIVHAHDHVYFRVRFHHRPGF